MTDKEPIEEVAAKLHEMFPGYMWQYYLDAVDALDVVASIERVQAIHSKTKHWDDDKTYTFICASCMSYYSCRTAAALDGAPEPEWEYAAGYTALDGKPHPFENRGYLRIVAEADREECGSDEAIIVRRRKAGPWLPVEGENK